MPSLVDRLLRVALRHSPAADSILGDLEEERRRVAARRGVLSARLWHTRQAMGIASHATWARRRRLPRPHPHARGIPRKGDPLMAEIWRDARFALRSLAKRPAFAATVILTLAVGLAANATIFGVLDGLVLRPFPLPHVDRLAQVFGRRPETAAAFGDRAQVSPADFLDWQRSSQVADFVSLDWWDAIVTGRTAPERVQAFKVSPAFFSALDVVPVRGRGFTADEGQAGRHQVAVLGHGFWERRYAADPAIVGQSILLDGLPYTVIGIAPRRFDYPYGSEVWTPAVFSPAATANRAERYLSVIARLRDGRTLAELRAELATVTARLAQTYPDTNRGWSVNVMSLPDALVDIGVGPFLAVWQGSAFLILLMACVNVANLLLARGADRGKELALRAALGASRGNLVRQLLVESLVMALAAAALAVPLAWAALTAVRGTMPANIARFVGGWREIDVDLRLLASLGALAAATAILFGLLPALRASRSAITDAIRESGRGAIGGSRLRHGIVVTLEMALALTLLVAAGLSLRSTLHVLNRDDGYDPGGVMAMRVALPTTKYGDADAQRRFFEALLDEVRTRPAVTAAAIVNLPPSVGGNTSRTIEIEGRPAVDVSRRPGADYRVMSPGYFDVLRIGLLRGRPFDTRDRPDVGAVAIVSERMAARFWPGEDVIGKRFRTAGADAPWRTIVGVARDVRHDWFMNRLDPTFYVPLAQAPESDLALVLRTTGDPANVTAEGRRAVEAIDPDQPIYDVRTLQQMRVDKALGLRYAAGFMGAFGLIGLLLAVVGVYGVMSYAVGTRTREIGIRIALGATRRAVLAGTIGHSLLFAGLGLVLGLLGAVALGKTMEQALFGGVQLDAATFILFPLLLAAMAVVASVVPARRAVRVDPVVALRGD